MSQIEAASPFAAEKAKWEYELQFLEQRRQAVVAVLESIAETERRMAAAVVGTVAQAVGESGPSRDGAGRRFETIVSVLRNAGQPLSVPEICREMIRRGDASGMKRLRDYVHAIVRRKREAFKRVEDAGRVAWRLADVKPEDGAVDEPDGAEAHRNGHADGASRPVRATVNDLANMTVVEAARVILRERDGDPMHYSKIAEEMLRRGYKSGRANPFRATTVATLLNGRRDEFEKVKAGTFRLMKSPRAAGAVG